MILLFREEEKHICSTILKSVQRGDNGETRGTHFYCVHNLPRCILVINLNTIVNIVFSVNTFLV